MKKVCFEKSRKFIRGEREIVEVYFVYEENQ